MITLAFDELHTDFQPENLLRFLSITDEAICKNLSLETWRDRLTVVALAAPRSIHRPWERLA